MACVLLQVKTVFEGWDPLRNPMQGLETMKQWKGILEGESQPIYNQGRIASRAMLPYDRLVWEVLMPVIRNTIM